MIILYFNWKMFLAWYFSMVILLILTFKSRNIRPLLYVSEEFNIKFPGMTEASAVMVPTAGTDT